MSDLFISLQGASLHKDAENLVLKKDGEKIFDIELKNIDTIQIFGNIQISTQLLKDFMNRGIELAFYTIKGDLLGQLTPPLVKNIEIRYTQYDLSKDEKFCLEFSKEIISLKFSNCIWFLEVCNKNRDDLNLVEELKHLRTWISKVAQAESFESLLGLEGSFSKEYFEVYGRLFKNPNFFHGRSKRPPKDEGNSILSFLYTLVTNRISAYMNGTGFDPYIGFYHKMDYGRMSLACDLVEPVRALFCDRVTLKIFNYHNFTSEDFEKTEEGFYLKEDSQKKFFYIYGKEFLSEYSYRHIHGTLQEYIEFLLKWLRACIKDKKVYSLEAFSEQQK